MKLHLPSTLRKAVLSCLAALASFLPSTLASGAAVAGGICSFALASSVALADDDDEDEENPWLYGDVISGDYGISTYSSATWTDPNNVEWGDNVEDLSNAQEKTLEGNTNVSYGVWGNNTWCFVEGEGSNLKLIKKGSNYKTILSKDGKQLKVSNLWLTYAEQSLNRNGNIFTIEHAGYLTSFIQNIYVNNVGLRIVANQTDLVTNFILGRALSVSAEFATDNTSFVVNAAVKTTGFLSIAEDTTVELKGGVLTVDHLEGGGDLTLHNSDTDGGSLVLTHGGSAYNQQLSFAVGNSVYDSIVVLGADDSAEAVQLKVSGLAGEHGVIRAASFASGGSGTLTITGASESNAASSISITGVNLVLEDGASQSLSGLTFSGGSITLGEGSHLAVSSDSSLDLSNGNIELSGSSATLSIVVSEQSGEAPLLTLSADGLTSLLSSGIQLALEGSFGDAEEVSFSFLTLSDGTLSEENRSALVSLISDKGYFGERAGVSISEDGTLTISTAGPLVWDSGNGTWFNGTVDNSHWESGAAFTNNESVQFGSGSGDVTIKGDVSVSSMSVTGGTWNFLNSTEETGSITINGNLVVSAGSATISADVATTLAGEIRVGDQASLNIGNFILDASINRLTVSREGESGAGNVELTGSLSAGTTVIANEGVTLSLNLTGNVEAATDGAISLAFSGGGNVVLKVAAGSTLALNKRVEFQDVNTRIELGDGASMQLGSQNAKNGIHGNGNITVHVDSGATGKLSIQGGHNDANNPFAYTGVITLEGAVDLNIFGGKVLMKGLVSDADGFTSATAGNHTVELGSGSAAGDSFNFQGLLSSDNNAVTISKSGEGTQIFSGSISDKIHFTVNGGKVVLSGSVEGSTHNATLTSGTLEYSGSGAATFGTLTTGTTTGTTPGELVVKNGSLTITTATGYTGELTLADGGTLNLTDAGEHALSAIHVATGQSGTIGVDVITQTQLSATNWDIPGTLNISLLGLTLENVATLDVETYQIFSEWDTVKDTLLSLKESNHLVISEVNFGRRVISFNWEDGTLDMTDGDPKDLTWAGTGTNDWFDASADHDRSADQFWTSPDADQFYNHDSVTFGEADNGQVTLNGDIIANDVTVHGNWTFSGAGGDDSFAIEGTLTVDDGKTLTIDQVTFNSDSLIVTGGGSVALTNATLTSSTLTLGGNVTLGATNGSTYGGTLALQDDTTLTLGSDLMITGWGTMGTNVTINSDGSARTFTLNGAGNVGRIDGTYTFGENVTLKKTGSGTFSFMADSIDVAGTGMLTVQGKLVVEQGNLYINNGADLQDVEIAAGAKLYFWKNSNLGRVINGTLSGDGELQTITEPLELRGGGRLGGNLVVGWSASVVLGADLEVGGIGSSGGAFSTIKKITDGQDVVLTVNTQNADVSAANVKIASGVTLKKTGSRKQTFTGADSALSGNVEVAEGELDISAITTKSIGGSLTLSGGTLNWGTANLAVGGDLSVQEDYSVGGDLTVTGAAKIASGKTFTVEDGRTVSFASLGTGVGTGGAVTVAQGGALTITAAAGGTISTLSLGGTLTLGGGTLNITTLDATSEDATLNVSLSGSTKLNVTNLGNNVATNGLHIELTLEDALSFLDDGYQLFGTEMPTVSDWEQNFDVIVSGNEEDDGLVRAWLRSDGRIVFELQVSELRWTGGSGVWREGGGENAWELLDESTTHRDFTNKDYVTFDNASGGTMTVTGEIHTSGLTVAQGDWVFADAAEGTNSLTITGGIEVQSGSASFTGATLTVGGTLTGEIRIESSDATSLMGDMKVGTSTATADVSFTGDGGVYRSGGTGTVTVASGSSLTVSNTGTKAIGAIIVEENATLTVTNAMSWIYVNSVTGEGTMVYKDISVGVDGENIQWSSFQVSVQHMLVASGIAENGTAYNLRSLELDNVQFKFDESGSNSLAPYIRSVKEFHIKEGSSVGFNGATFNNSRGKNLYLSGSGASGEGALYLTGTAARTVNRNVILEGDAWINTNQTEENGTRLEIVNAFDAGGRTAAAEDGEREGYVLHKTGYGTLALRDNNNGDTFTVAENSKGTFEVHQGALTISAAAAATCLANYDVKLSGGNLGLMIDSTTIHALYGESTDSKVDTYKRADSADIEDTADTVRTLVINNTDTSATTKNTYAGGISGTVKLALTGGYEKLTGAFEDGAAFSAESADATNAATLELAGRFDGAHTLNVGDSGTLKLADASRGADAALTILASGSTGVINGLTLSSGDVLGFVDAPVSGNDPAVTATLLGDTVLEGGSTLQFGVTNTGDDSAKNWVTATKLVVGGTLNVTATSSNTIDLVVDPYARMAGGEMLAMSAGQKHLLIEGGMTADMLSAFAPSQLAGRFVYELSVENGNLYILVTESAGILVWNEAAGGDWNATNAWHVESGSALLTFREGDAVVFDTLADATDPVVVTVADDTQVSVSGITVKGSTNYVINGSITGTSDLGLTVGTDEAAFTGTLTLTGENSWSGETVINSGVVVAAHESALSNTDTTVNLGAELQLDIDGAALASEVHMNGGYLTAISDASATLAEVSEAGAILQAAEGSTLTVETPDTMGMLMINSDDEMTGEVKLSLAEGQTGSGTLYVQQGELTLSASGADATLSAAGVQIQADATVTVEAGVTLAGEMLDTEGALVMEAGSTLSSTGTIGKLESRGATLNGNDYTEVSGELTLAGAATTMEGVWEVKQVNGGELATADEADVTLRAGALDAATVAGGVLHAGNGLQVGSLQMTSGALAGADDYLATVRADTVQISGDAEVRSEVTLELSGTGSEISGGTVAGSIIVDNADGSADLTISGGEVSGDIDIIQGHVTLTPNATVTGNLTVYGRNGSTLDLGGSATGADITLYGGGTLKHAEAYTGTLVIDDCGVTPGISFDLGGLGTSAKITIVSLNGGNSVSNLDSLTLVGENTIYINSDLQVGADSVQPLFTFNGSGSLTLEQGASLFVDVSSVIGDVLSAGQDGLSYQVSNKSLSSWDGLFTYDATAIVLGWEISYYGNGIMHFLATGETPERNIYQSTEQQGSSNSWADASDGRDIYESVGSWGAIVVDKQTDIDLTGTTPSGKYVETGLLMHNLMGTDAGDLNIKGDGKSKVTFRNDVSDAELDSLRDQLGGDLVRNSLTYGGNISITNADLEVNHVESMYSSKPNVDSTTTVLGDLKLTNGNLTMTSGRLELNGSGNELSKDVTFHEFQGQVSVGGKLTVSGTISVEHDAMAVGEERAHLQLKSGAELELAGGSAVGADVIIGSNVTESTPQVAGTIRVAENRLSGKASISADSKLRHVVLDVAGTLEVQPAEVAAFFARSVDAGWTLAGITGRGALAVADAASKDIDFLVGGEDRYFYGDLAEYTGTMTFRKSDLTQYFTGVTGGTGWSVTNAEGAHLVFNMAEEGGNNKLTMGDLHLDSGSFTTILMDLEHMNTSSGMHLQGLNIADGADVTIGQYRGTVWLEGEDGEEHSYVLGSINVAEGGDKTIGEDVQWHLKGIRNADKVKVSVDENGKVTATVTQDNTNLYAQYTDNANSAAGAQMLWGKNDTADLSALDERVYELLGKDAPKTADDVAEANRILAAAAGSSLAVLGRAFSADIERQLRTMRNRTAGMAPQARSEEEWGVNTWLNAENNYYKQDADAMMPGFKTTGWGGTVGVDTTLGKSTVVGLALSAMYNDVDSDGPDQLKGNMDTFYVSAFAQVTDHSWRHTFICTLGRADIDTTRTVNYGTGSYTTQGNTDSMGLGLMYELGYSVALNQDATSCLQTVFNVAWQTSRINDFSETGSDAALKVTGQNYNSLTLGFGARVQAAVGANAWNRIGVLEARALVKTELADREGVAGVAFQRAGSPEAQVKSSEKGAVGVELGAGLSLPVSGVSDVFVDFSVEVWKNLVEMNAGIGYKVSF